MVKYSKSGKPIFKDCRNCEYGEYAFCFDAKCDIKYEYVRNARLKAFFCRFFKISEKKLNE